MTIGLDKETTTCCGGSKNSDASIAAAGHRYVSAITAYEIGVKYHKGKLILPKLPQLWFSETISRRGLCF
ncbi:hypothetical protein ES705_29116 [subsurface metagenome]